jgi:hypothetical protein
MPVNDTNLFIQSVLEKYKKRIIRLSKAIKEGKFSRYSAEKKSMLLLCLFRYEKQLVHWGITFTSGAALLLSINSAQAQTPVPVGDEFRVNTYVTNDSSRPSIAMDSDGDFVVTWAEGGNSGDVYAQIFNDTGIAQGDEFQVNTYTASTQAYQYIAMDSGGDFVITWSSLGQDGSDFGIYAQRYDNTGTAQGIEFRVNTFTAGRQFYSSVAMDSDGDFVVTWDSEYQDGSSRGIYAQRFDKTGAPLGVEFRVNTFTTNTQLQPSIAMDSDGNFVITWSSISQDESSWGIYAQRYDSAGIAQGTEFLVNTYTTNYQEVPSVAMDDDGDFVITWDSNWQDGNLLGIYAQRFDNIGTTQGTEFRVNTYTTSYQYITRIAMDSDGDFVITWSSNGQDGSSFGIYAQHFNNAGIAQGSEFRVNTYTTGVQLYPSIAMDNDGDFVVTWESWYQEGSSLGIYAQRFSFSTGIICDVPDELSTTNINNNSATLNWEPVSEAIKYKIRLQNIHTGSFTTIIATPNQASTLVESLTPDTRYRWFIKVKCPSGWTVASPWQLFRTTGIFGLVDEVSDMNGYSGNDEAVLQNDSRIALHPNPASDVVVLSTSNQPFQSVRISDLTGRIVMEQSGLNTSHLEIDVHAFANGLYHLYTQSGDISNVMPLVIIR